MPGNLYSQNLQLTFAHKNDFYPNYLKCDSTFTNLLEKEVYRCTWEGRTREKKEKKYNGIRDDPVQIPLYSSLYQKEKTS